MRQFMIKTINSIVWRQTANTYPEVEDTNTVDENNKPIISQYTLFGLANNIHKHLKTNYPLIN